MAHSPWMISNPAEKISRAGAASAGRSQNSQNKTQTSFAEVMSKESGTPKDSDSSQTRTAQKRSTAQSTASRQDSQKKTRPRVESRTEGIPLAGLPLSGRISSDLVRGNSFSKAQADLQQTQAMGEYMRSFGSNTSALGIARNLSIANNLRTIAAGGNGKGFALNSGDYIHTPKRRVESQTRSKRKQTSDASGGQRSGMGKLSARFESGSDGIAAIGYDRTGGTSYGKYQIASRVGSMKSFLEFLDNEAPDLSKRLRASGPANTGSRTGAMPSEWRAIAKEQPERFERLQEAFIHQSHYQPALEAIGKNTGLDTKSLSAAMAEVIWSTAVQHGPAGAARIFASADNMSGKPTDKDYERKLISNVYNLRAGQFGSSTSQVRESVRNRFRQEKQLALDMLESGSRPSRA